MAEISKSRAIALIVSSGTLYAVWGLLLALQPPFYPTEAEKKGATPSQYGFVFGIANLAAFISAPIFGRFGPSIGLKYLYNFGTFVQALCGLAFGLLDYVQDVTAFLGLSYFLRFLGGMADAAAWGSVVSILMKVFPNHVTVIASWTEMLLGLGYMLGPALGSFLYTVGGFTLPFLTVGGFALFMSIVLCLVVPPVNMDATDVQVQYKRITFSNIIKHPLIFMPFIDNFICFCGDGMIESMLEPHMKSAAQSTQLEVGVAFLILGGLYMVCSLLAGLICDRIKYPTIISIAGNVLMAIAFLLVGPVPFITSIPTSTGLIQGSTAILGAGYALVIVSTFGRSQGAAIRNGFNNDLDTYIFISSMWSSSFFLGNFVGPTVSGILVESYGFRTTTLVFFAIYCLNILVDVGELTYQIKINSKNDYERLE